ncbi:MAG: hypothetical protein JXK04_00620 [Campylobacterales bacterium]|nr:hypothetical protein [Campylobacterales bacterium]
MKETITAEMEEIRNLIVATVARRNLLKQEMEKWYAGAANQRFEQTNELITVDATLSELDSHYKRLWDYHNTKG